MQYAPQSGKTREEEDFLLLFAKTLSDISGKERVVARGDINCLVGAASDGYKGVHCGHGFGQRNVEGDMFFELASALELVVLNTCFQKCESHKLTFDSVAP